MMHHRMVPLLLVLLLCTTPGAYTESTLSDVPHADLPTVVGSEQTAVSFGDDQEPAHESAAPVVVNGGLELLGHCVYYPVVTGMQDTTLQTAVNELLYDKLGIQPLLDRLPAVMTSPVPLRTEFTAEIRGDILTCIMTVQGPAINSRSTHIRRAVNVDLRTGELITPDDLFEDADAACERMADYLEYELAPTLSAHLQNSSLTPLPEDFALSAQGLTLCYPIEQLSTLSDRAGAITLQWCELSGLMLEEGSVLHRIGAAQSLTLDENSLPLLTVCAESGALPGIPATLGGSMKQATDTYRMLIDPDLCEAGRMFSLEDSAFRCVYLLTDALTRSWDDSVIQGIRADSINLYGLCTGVTTREEWLAVLGEPDFSAVLEGNRAEAWRLCEGTSDYYLLGGRRLRLHANEDGVLVSLFLTP